MLFGAILLAVGVVGALVIFACGLRSSEEGYSGLLWAGNSGSRGGEMNNRFRAFCGAAVCMSMLSGCNAYADWRHPEIAACDDYTTAALKAPSTYGRIKTTISDSRLPTEYWQENLRETLGQIPPKELTQLVDGLDRRYASEGGVRTVLIEYDAQNSFGVPVRGLSMCRFEMSSIDDSEFFREPSASGAKLNRMTAAINGSEDSIDCCESKSTMARLEKYRVKEKYLSQQVFH